MILKLAWRNIWRNSRRSIIALSSISVGVFAILLSDGLNTGMIEQILSNQISSSVSHIQIHNKGYNDNKVIQSIIPEPAKVEQTIKKNPEVKSFSKRVIAFGLLSSASSSTGMFIYGVDHKDEPQVSSIKDAVIEGEYLMGNDKEIVVGKKLSEKLGVGIGDKVVAMSNTPDGAIGSDVYRIVGIYATASSEFDKVNVFINIKAAQKLLEIGNDFHEFALILNDIKKLEVAKDEINRILSEGKYEVLTYRDLLPSLILQIDLYKESMWIINLIVGLALIFGIINTMLMSVFERINELGVLMSIGMKNRKIFSMIVSEALILGVIGTLVGLLIGAAVLIPLSNTGIDFSWFAAGLESWGVGSIVYPSFMIENLITTIILIPFITVIGAMYPALKAIRLEPVSAIRYV
ncbi:MAG: ABC transporter permease [Melioribacteraceae bacterium]|nr:ABC transporter permease [Melioribacteraceae bacterium]MCF8265807.1 ABC transporter permease [Melioribacteraceae bacterium]MCF8414524.1 ABC transporter permease [Melioribacteraceae bacterium]MCF8430532.1 ABC transporter permease [Melioribacteraceae bacterium]